MLDVEPLLEDFQIAVTRPRLFVRVPARQFSPEDLIADFLQDLVGVVWVFIVRHEIKRLFELIQGHVGKLKPLDRLQSVHEGLPRTDNDGTAIEHVFFPLNAGRASMWSGRGRASQAETPWTEKRSASGADRKTLRGSAMNAA